MTCPNPFNALEALQVPTAQSWVTHCNWSAFLGSEAATLDSNLYSREKCMNLSGSDTAMQCPMLNQYCNSTEFVFGSGLLLTVCSLYPSMILGILGSDTPTVGRTIDNTERTQTQRYAFEVSSVVSTGLLSYCALIPGCSRLVACSTALLFDSDGRLDTQGVARCWDRICSSYVANINPDFGGLGVRWQLQNTFSSTKDDYR